MAAATLLAVLSDQSDEVFRSAASSHVDADGVGAARARTALPAAACVDVRDGGDGRTRSSSLANWLSPTPLPRSSSFAGTDILCFAPKKDDDDAVRAAHEQQRSGFE